MIVRVAGSSSASPSGESCTAKRGPRSGKPLIRFTGVSEIVVGACTAPAGIASANAVPAALVAATVPPAGPIDRDTARPRSSVGRTRPLNPRRTRSRPFSRRLPGAHATFARPARSAGTTTRSRPRLRPTTRARLPADPHARTPRRPQRHDLARHRRARRHPQPARVRFLRGAHAQRRSRQRAGQADRDHPW